MRASEDPRPPQYRVAAGEAVTGQVDWPHVVEEIEHGHGQRDDQDEIPQLRARLSAAEALIKELRARLDDTASKLTNSQAELTTAQDQAEAATARAVAAVEAEQAVRQADDARRARGRWARLRAVSEVGN